jgi:hypothetical protein
MLSPESETGRSKPHAESLPVAVAFAFTFAVAGLASQTAGVAWSTMQGRYGDPELTVFIALAMSISGGIFGILYGGLIQGLARVVCFHIRYRFFFWTILCGSVVAMIVLAAMHDRTHRTVSGPLFWIVLSGWTIGVTVLSARSSR